MATNKEKEPTVRIRFNGNSPEVEFTKTLDEGLYNFIQHDARFMWT
jgi:hypothetical protein